MNTLQNQWFNLLPIPWWGWLGWLLGGVLLFLISRLASQVVMRGFAGIHTGLRRRIPQFVLAGIWGLYFLGFSIRLLWAYPAPVLLLMALGAPIIYPYLRDYLAGLDLQLRRGVQPSHVLWWKDVPVQIKSLNLLQAEVVDPEGRTILVPYRHWWNEPLTFEGQSLRRKLHFPVKEGVTPENFRNQIQAFLPQIPYLLHPLPEPSLTFDTNGQPVLLLEVTVLSESHFFKTHELLHQALGSVAES